MDYDGPNRVSLNVYAYDLKPGVILDPGERPRPGQFYHEVERHLSILITSDNPPEAIDGSMEIGHWDYECSGPVKFQAEDPDLPDNFGYNLYFSLPHPKDWDCSTAINHYFLPGTPGLSARCSGNTCERSFSCPYLWCSYPDHPIPRGTYEFPFTVMEYRRFADDPKDPANYGFSDTGRWTLIVGNEPPSVIVENKSSSVSGEPEEARARSTHGFAPGSEQLGGER